MQLNKASTGNVPYMGDGSTGVDIGTNLILEHLTGCILYFNHESFWKESTSSCKTRTCAWNNLHTMLFTKETI